MQKYVYKIQIVKTDNIRYEILSEKYYQTNSLLTPKLQVRKIGKYIFYKYTIIIK